MIILQADDDISSISSVRHNMDRYTWVKLLWRKVIIRAIYDYVLWRDVPKVRKRHDAQDAARWLFEESDLNNSLEKVCEVADVDPGKIRAYARTATKAEVKKLEHIERDRAGRGKCLELPPEEDLDGIDE